MESVRYISLFTEKLIWHRKKAGLTPAEVADKAGISLKDYLNIEKGMQNPTENMLVKLADILKCSRANLLHDENEYRNQLNTIIRSAVLGESLYEFFDEEDYMSGRIHDGIREVFKEWAEDFKNSYPDFYNQYIDEPTYEGLVTLYRTYIWNQALRVPDLYPHASEIEPVDESYLSLVLVDRDECRYIAGGDAYQLAFCVAMDRYLYDTAGSDGATSDALEYARIEDRHTNRYRGMQLFAVDLLVPYLDMLLVALDFLEEYDITIEGFTLALIFHQPRYLPEHEEL